MKKFAALFCLLAAGLFAEENFWDSLTPEQRAIAGIQNLSEPQRAALNALARHYVSGQTEHQVTRARDRAVAEVRAQVKAEEAKKIGFEEKSAPAAGLRTRIAGPFRGWSKGTVFRLENGQTWAVDNGAVEARFFTLRESPEVELKPAGFGSWKLYLLPEGLWVRVKRVQ